MPKLFWTLLFSSLFLLDYSEGRRFNFKNLFHRDTEQIRSCESRRSVACTDCKFKCPLNDGRFARPDCKTYYKCMGGEKACLATCPRFTRYCFFGCFVDILLNFPKTVDMTSAGNGACRQALPGASSRKALTAPTERASSATGDTVIGTLSAETGTPICASVLTGTPLMSPPTSANHRCTRSARRLCPPLRRRLRRRPS